MSGFADLVGERAVVICCGPGGVGKTTTAAAIVVEAARLGRRACVVTIDPAKRLADALGLEFLGNTARLVEGEWPGELWALMLDTKTTFDELVGRYATSDGQAEGILGNRLYRNISGALSGTQEYMAMEKLYELHASDQFDLVVVDTPPSRNALDFLDAPRRLTRFLDNRIFRLLMLPTRAYMRAVSVATQAFLRTVSKVVGTDVVKDAVAFFSAFEGMEQGFRERAASVDQLLGDDRTAFVLVASPRRDAVEEALYFADRLHDSAFAVQGLVVNRLHPQFPPAPPKLLAKHLEPGSPLASLVENLADLQGIGAREEAHVATLVDAVAPAPVARVPFLVEEVHDLRGLTEVGDHLFGRPAPPP